MKSHLTILLILIMKNSKLLFFLPLILLSCCKHDLIPEPVPNNPLNGKTTAIFNPSKKYGTVIDIDGNAYKTIVIGTQTWMAENLRVTRYSNGDSVPNVTDTAKWMNLLDGAYCNYNNTSSLDTIATYGRLYNWYAATDSRNIAPKGWRVANAEDWLILFDYLGGDTIASNKLKEAGSIHWRDPFHSDNSSGFTALPGGFIDKANPFDGLRFFGCWWVASDYDNVKAPFFFLFFYDSKIWKGFNYKLNGYSLRCIKE